MQFDPFTRAYIETALRSSSAELGTDLSFTDLDYTVDHIAPEALAKMVADCAKFQEQCGDLFTVENCPRCTFPVTEYAAHDFWLTRNGHGCGFWDGDWEEPAASKLDEAAKAFGECDLYRGDDGQVWI